MTAMLRFISVLSLALSLYSCSDSGPSDAQQSAVEAFDKADAVEITWEMLQEIDIDSGKAPETLQSLDGKLVKLPGFIAPMDADEGGGIKQFVIVPYQGACIHTPPPPANQMVLVEDAPQRQELSVEGDGLYLAYWFYGRLALSRQDSAFGDVASALTPMLDMIEWEPPELDYSEPTLEDFEES